MRDGVRRFCAQCVCSSASPCVRRARSDTHEEQYKHGCHHRYGGAGGPTWK